jgi:hypothetical protein
MRDTGAERDRALQRLRRTTSVTLVGAGALLAVFAGIAAKALPGHRTVRGAPVRTATRHPRATPPPLVSAGSQAAPPAAPASPPVQSQAPPVVVSGGT